MLLAPIVWLADARAGAVDLLSVAPPEIPVAPEIVGPAEPAASASPQSQPIRPLPYTYLQAAYVFSDADHFDDEPQGWELDLSFALGDSWFAFAGFSQLDGKTGVGSVDLDGWNAGLGFHTGAAATTDLVISGRWIETDVDGGGVGVSGDDRGYGIEALLRVDAGPKFEIDTGILYVDLEDSGSDTILEFGASWYVVRQFGLTAWYTTSDDADTFLVGVRVLP